MRTDLHGSGDGTAGPIHPGLERVGVLAFDDGTGTRWDALRRGLRELGWIEGQNLTLDWRSANTQSGQPSTERSSWSWCTDYAR